MHRSPKNYYSLLMFCLMLPFLAACQPENNTQTSTNNATEQKSRAPMETVYAVGSRTLFIHDDTRPFDSVGGVNVGVRSMITEIWYPVAQDTIRNAEPRYSRANYGDYVFADMDVHKKMMTNTTFFHLTKDSVLEDVSQAAIDSAIQELFLRKRGSYKNAPIASSADKFPVVVMSHGDAGSRYNMESACEYLASRGYVVIAPEHTGNSPFAMTAQDPEIDGKLAAVKPYLNEDGTYGKPENYGQTYTPLIRDRSNPEGVVKLDLALLQRVNDLRATLAKLDEMNQTGEFAGKLNLDRIGLMGRSFGGTTTIASLNLEPRFTAGIAVVPLVTPDFRTHFPQELLKDTESVILGRQGATALHRLDKPTLLLSGAEDALIIGVGAELAKDLGTDTPTVDNPLPPLRTIYEQSNQPVVWGLLQDSNHSSFGVSGGYWWPELKPNTQSRTFEPGKEFQLIEASRAHTIQKEKVLQFFDHFIDQKPSAEKKLLHNEFLRDGLIYETRNF